MRICGWFAHMRICVCATVRMSNQAVDWVDAFLSPRYRAYQFRRLSQPKHKLWTREEFLMHILWSICAYAYLCMRNRAYEQPTDRLSRRVFVSALQGLSI